MNSKANEAEGGEDRLAGCFVAAADDEQLPWIGAVAARIRFELWELISDLPPRGRGVGERYLLNS